MSALAPVLVLASAIASAGATKTATTAHALGRPPKERGVALGLFSADPRFRYAPLVEEIRALGATHLAITWVHWQDDLRANEIRPVAGWSATDEQIADTMRAAKALGLHVTAFPIIRLSKSARDEWRGRIAPSDEDAWWQSYRAFILHAASLATAANADRLCVGSELVSRERMRARWLEVIDNVRAEAPRLELLYSANWDHYEDVSFWDAVDVVGLTGYWELTRSLDATVDDLALAWRGIKTILGAWSARVDRPIVLAEIGYPSLDGAAAWPWNETRSSAIDLEEQRRAYEAFARSWSGVGFLQGVYWWNWFGFGGEKDASYTPRGKPAAEVIRAWYRGS